jgi:hypothetical protein
MCGRITLPNAYHELQAELLIMSSVVPQADRPASSARHEDVVAL